ncbi:MAG: hypothetical protein COY80_00270 [Candidatus Pacebacteria bacterium CG_4_10_14_0_8_um_filter_42_14]|nr:MAG: hypothetical protein COY80_00270 [Candidatus Pacebacteria bacterium CG_4_10_14_0_8_um_filter_42_14]
MKQFWVFWLGLWLYAIWSFGLTDPNLVLTSFEPYLHFQNNIWHFATEYRQVFSYMYVGIIAWLFLSYFWLVKWLRQNKISLPFKKLILWFLILMLPLFFSYNALSHDVFNYLFNAKMVVLYNANPHIKVALDFAQDDWTRFMHNTHTPAPYGYGWTIFSLIPFSLGFGKFTLTWLLFRGFSILSLVLTFVALQAFAKVTKIKLGLAEYALFFLNPLVLLEIVSNQHNDLWMMVPVIFSFVLLAGKPSRNLLKTLGLSSLLFLVSVSIKYATLALIPPWLFVAVVYRFEEKLLQSLRLRLHLPVKLITAGIGFFSKKVFCWIPTIAALIMLMPLFTERSQQFLPWYLVWSLVWLPFIKQPIIRSTLLVLSLSSILRYVPWLWDGGYGVETLAQQKLITWVAPILWFFFQVFKGKKTVSEKLVELQGKTVNE